MKTTAEKIAVMQAFLDGKKIQAIEHGNPNPNDWVDEEQPSWDWVVFDYRVAKPKPKTIKKKVTLVLWDDETVALVPEDHVVSWQSRPPHCVKVMEVEFEVSPVAEKLKVEGKQDAEAPNNDVCRCEQLQEENKQLKEALEAYLSAGHKETRRLASIKAKKAIGLPEDYKTPLSK